MALEHHVSDLIIVGDSRLAIQQAMGVIARRKDTLQIELKHINELVKQIKSVCYLHVVRSFNAAADFLTTTALETKTGQ